MAEKAIFKGASGIDEIFIAMTAETRRNFTAEAMELWQRLEKSCGDAALVWVRAHLSDITNQLPVLRRLWPPECCWCAVGQPPAGGAKIALEAYALAAAPARAVQCDTGAVKLNLSNYRVEFIHDLGGLERDGGSLAQTAMLFAAAEKHVTQGGGRIADNLLRTWLYCRDIDNHYPGLVKARRDFFSRCELTEKTHYIASTGIEGIAVAPSELVQMNALAVYGHRPEQIEYMSALDHLSPTHFYGVTFERGTRMILGDRSWYWISGTASIDRDGKTLYEQDIRRQALRMIENFRALLENHGSELADLRQAVIYLRDSADREAVEEVLAEQLCPATARIMVRAAVCRPEWLVEMDGIAVNGKGDRRFKPFQ